MKNKAEAFTFGSSWVEARPFFGKYPLDVYKTA